MLVYFEMSREAFEDISNRYLQRIKIFIRQLAFINEGLEEINIPTRFVNEIAIERVFLIEANKNQTLEIQFNFEIFDNISENG